MGVRVEGEGKLLKLLGEELGPLPGSIGSSGVTADTPALGSGRGGKEMNSKADREIDPWAANYHPPKGMAPFNPHPLLEWLYSSPPM